MSNKITKKKLKKIDRIIESNIDYKFLNSANCNKNSIKYIKNNEFIVDCFTPQKIYRYIYDIKYSKTGQKIKEIEKDISSKDKKLEALLNKIKTGYNNVDKVSINKTRDEIKEIDDELVLLKYNLSILKNKEQTIEFSDKPSKMFIINRIKETSFIQQELIPEKKGQIKQIQEKQPKEKSKLEEITEVEQEVLSPEQMNDEFQNENEQENFANVDEEVTQKGGAKYIKQLIKKYNIDVDFENEQSEEYEQPEQPEEYEQSEENEENEQPEQSEEYKQSEENEGYGEEEYEFLDI